MRTRSLGAAAALIESARLAATGAAGVRPTHHSRPVYRLAAAR